MELTASDRSALLRLAAALPLGSEERKTILSGLKHARTGRPSYYFDVRFYPVDAQGKDLPDKDEKVFRNMDFRNWNEVDRLVRKLEGEGYRLMSLT